MMFRRKKIGRGSIKEGFDHLPAAVCYFNEKGLLVLCNHAMDRLCFDLTDRDLQMESDLRFAVEQLPDGIFMESETKVWKFRKTSLIVEGTPFTEYVASDITQFYQQNEELRVKNHELMEVLASMEEIQRNLVAIAREEEILSMKMMIHNEMGQSVLSLHRYYANDCPRDERDALIHRMENTVAMLYHEVGKTDQVDDWEDLLSTAQAVGANIALTGTMPNEKAVKSLLVAAMRECLTNVIRHAGGNTIYVTLEQEPDFVTAQITNNGEAPTETIVEGGGLSSLRRMIEKSGGTMNIQSFPEYKLTVSVPLKGGDLYD